MGNEAICLAQYPAPGIRLARNNTFAIDCIKCVKGVRIHIYSSGYLTPEEALEAMPYVIADRLEEHAKECKNRMLFKEFYEKYEEYRLRHVRVSTVHFGRSVVSKYLFKWNDMTLRHAFCQANVEEVYNALLKASGTPAWKNRCIGTLRQMANAAFKWRLIDANAYQDAMSILENIPENRGQRKEKEVWSEKERELFLASIDNPTDKILFTLYAYLGARIGEFAGLTWDCFYPKQGYIEIKQQLVYADKGKWVLSEQLKTAESYRVCRLPTKLVAMLNEYKVTSNGEGFLFKVEGTDSPVSKASIRRKMYFYANKAGLKKVTPHALRHSKAMDLMRVCKNMQEVKAAARFLGHSATMMVDTYGHSEKRATDAVIKRLEKEE